MVRIVAYIQAVVDGVLEWGHGRLLLLRRRDIRDIRSNHNYTCNAQVSGTQR